MGLAAPAFAQNVLKPVPTPWLFPAEPEQEAPPPAPAQPVTQPEDWRRGVGVVEPAPTAAASGPIRRIQGVEVRAPQQPPIPPKPLLPLQETNALALPLAPGAPAPIAPGGFENRRNSLTPITAPPLDAPAPLDPDYALGVEANIESEQLIAPSPESVGLYSVAADGPQALGVDMWRGSTAQDALAALRSVRPTRLRAANDLIRRLLAAPAQAPEGASGMVYLRASRLMDMGATEAAAQLTESAVNVTDTDMLTARADAALAAGHDAELCADLSIRDFAGQDEFLSLLRAYCSARAGDARAAIALSAMRERGVTDQLTAGLIEAMTDEGLAPYVDTPSPAQLTPLRLAAMRAIGKAPDAYAAREAPLSILGGMMNMESTDLQTQILAAERLESAGVYSTDALRQLYFANEPEGRGGVWSRVSAARNAQLSPSAARISGALTSTYREAGPAAFGMLARVIGPAAARLDPASSPADEAARNALRDALLLAGEPRAAKGWSAPDDPVFAFADPEGGGLSVEQTQKLRAQASQGDVSAATLIAVLTAFGLENGALDDNAPYLRAAREGRRAEAAFGALAALADAPGAARAPLRPQTLATALTALNIIGLSEEARRIGVEAALLSRQQ